MAYHGLENLKINKLNSQKMSHWKYHNGP